MKKIIAAIDSLHFSDEQVEGFKYFAREGNSELMVVCLDNITTGTIPMRSMFINTQKRPYCHLWRLWQE